MRRLRSCGMGVSLVLGIALNAGCMGAQQDSQEEDSPALDRPFGVVKLDACPSFDEQRDENLHVPYDLLRS